MQCNSAQSPPYSRASFPNIGYHNSWKIWVSSGISLLSIGSSLITNKVDNFSPKRFIGQLPLQDPLKIYSCEAMGGASAWVKGFSYVNISYSSHTIFSLSPFNTCILTKSLFLFINKYLLMIYYTTSPILGAADRTVSKIGQIPGAYFLLGRNKQEECAIMCNNGRRKNRVHGLQSDGVEREVFSIIQASRKTSLMRWYVSRDLDEVESETCSCLRKSAPERGNRKHKVPEAGVCLFWWRSDWNRMRDGNSRRRWDHRSVGASSCTSL